MPTFVTAPMFCASQDTWVSYGWCLLIRDIFTWFETTGMRRQQNLQSALGIQKENLGYNHAFFRDNIKASIWKKRHILLCILLFSRILVA